MNVKELKEIIKDLPDNMEVILQGDSEGNSYFHLLNADSNCICYEDTVLEPHWSAEDCCLEEDEWDELKKQDKCLVLAP